MAIPSPPAPCSTRLSFAYLSFASFLGLFVGACNNPKMQAQLESTSTSATTPNTEVKTLGEQTPQVSTQLSLSEKQQTLCTEGESASDYDYGLYLPRS